MIYSRMSTGGRNTSKTTAGGFLSFLWWLALLASTVWTGDADTPSPTTDAYLDCTGIVSFIGDAVCDSENNNEECAFDGGDCCICTCTDSPPFDCGFLGFECLDTSAPCCEYHTKIPRGTGGSRKMIIGKTLGCYMAPPK